MNKNKQQSDKDKIKKGLGNVTYPDRPASNNQSESSDDRSDKPKESGKK